MKHTCISFTGGKINVSGVCQGGGVLSRYVGMNSHLERTGEQSKPTKRWVD